MADPVLPLRRRLIAHAVAVAPATAALGGLVAAGALEWRPATLAWLGVAAVTVLVVRRYLAGIGAFARFVGQLGGDVAPEQPRFTFAPAADELAAAASTLSIGWQRDRAARESLAASAQAIVDGLPDPLVAVDRERRVARCNSAAVALLGAPPFGRDLAVYLRQPDLFEAVDAALAGSPPAAAGGADAPAAEFALAGPPERRFAAFVRRLPRQAADGSLALVVLHDVTALRRAERMRADFVANASHELKTPLAGLLGFVETLRGAARDDPAVHDRFLGIMAEQAERMRRLVDDLLALSQIEQREHTRPEGAVDVGARLAMIADLLQLRAAERDIRIVLEIEDGLPQAAGDRDELTAAFQNLMDNAVKYGRKGGEVRVGARRAADAAGWIEVAVADSGDGIAPQHLPRLTERFYRVDDARSRQMGGTGLGLAIVKHVVNRHRGRLDISSEQGVGSTFTIRIPAA